MADVHCQTDDSLLAPLLARYARCEQKAGIEVKVDQGTSWPGTPGALSPPS